MTVGLLIAFAYFAVSFGFARHAYRHEYRLIYGSPAPHLYGGKHGHDRAHEVALREACWWLAMWPLFCTWAGMGWLISHGSTQDWVERDNKISQAQREVDRLAAQQDPLRQLDDKCRHGESSISRCAVCSAPPDPPLKWIDDAVKQAEQIKPESCPCGYTGECVIHCGDGSKCHPVMSRAQKLVSPYPIIRTEHPEAIRQTNMAGEIVIDIPGCGCPECDPGKYPKIGFRYER